MAKIHFPDLNVTLEAKKGQNILEVALDNHIELDHACGGVCACSTCHVYVEKGEDALTEAEDNENDQLDNAPSLKLNSRLACQSEITDDDAEIVVRIPAWNRNLAREGAKTIEL